MASKLANDLKSLVDTVDPVMFPVKNGDRINIGSYSIKPTKDGYSVKSYKSNYVVATTFSKAAAIALAKTLSKNRSVQRDIFSLDNTIAKYSNDCMFYKHIIDTTKDIEKLQITITRYEIAKQLEGHAREKLNKFILN